MFRNIFAGNDDCDFTLRKLATDSLKLSGSGWPGNLVDSAAATAWKPIFATEI
jgi:hypothetical protein